MKRFWLALIFLMAGCNSAADNQLTFQNPFTFQRDGLLKYSVTTETATLNKQTGSNDVTTEVSHYHFYPTGEGSAYCYLLDSESDHPTEDHRIALYYENGSFELLGMGVVLSNWEISSDLLFPRVPEKLKGGNEKLVARYKTERTPQSWAIEGKKTYSYEGQGELNGAPCIKYSMRIDGKASPPRGEAAQGFYILEGESQGCYSEENGNYLYSDSTMRLEVKNTRTEFGNNIHMVFSHSITLRMTGQPNKSL